MVYNYFWKLKQPYDKHLVHVTSLSICNVLAFS